MVLIITDPVSTGNTYVAATAPRNIWGGRVRYILAVRDFKVFLFNDSLTKLLVALLTLQCFYSFLFCFLLIFAGVSLTLWHKITLMGLD